MMWNENECAWASTEMVTLKFLAFEWHHFMYFEYCFTGWLLQELALGMSAGVSFGVDTHEWVGQGAGLGRGRLPAVIQASDPSQSHEHANAQLRAVLR